MLLLRKLVLLFFLFFGCHASCCFSQKKIEVTATSLKYDKLLGEGAKRLIGNVKLKHENTLIYCDSAYSYSDNTLIAFSHVHILQDDSMHIYGDLLKYNGNTKKAIIIKNVIANKGDMKLTTDELNYDMSNKVGSYTKFAVIVNRENILTSMKGYLFAKTDDLTFKNDVELINPELIIKCDTMCYNMSSKIACFIGPTTITGKENLIYCENGWYNTIQGISRFSKNSYILTKTQKMYGDSLYYDRKHGIAKALKNVQIIDTTNNFSIKGDYAIYYDFLDLSLMTGNVLLTQLYDMDTLYLHADTLKSIGGNSKYGKIDANKRQFYSRSDTTINYTNSKPQPSNQKLFAYHKVKFFRRNLQGKCDSLIYTTIDSTMKLYGKPTLWAEQNQLTADSICLLIGIKNLKSVELKNKAFVVSQIDSSKYDQIRGKYMMGFFANNELHKIDVKGEGQTLYYVREKQKVNAVNRADCSDLKIYLKDNKVNRINFIVKPEAILYPLNEIGEKDLKLKNFVWRISDRPHSFKDIFVW